MDALHHKRLLHGEESSDDVVVHFCDQFQSTSPSSVGINLFEEFLGALWYVVVLEEQVLDLTEVPCKDRVKIDTNESFFSKLSLFTDKQVLVELILGVFFDTSGPLFKLSLDVLLCELLLERLVKLDNIFVLFTVL